jgi:hypothetical protein
MTTFGLPTSMFLVFVATILAGSIGAIHYLIVHVIMGKPFAEIPPPIVREKPEVAAGGAGSGESRG